MAQTLRKVVPIAKPSFGDMLAKAEPKAKAKGKETAPVIETTPEQKKQVDHYVNLKGQKTEIEAEMDLVGDEIRGFTQPFQDKDGLQGHFKNAYVVPGEKSKLKFVSVNKFTINASDAPDIEAILGERFNDMLHAGFEVKLKEEIFFSEEKQAILMDRMGDIFNEYFDTTQTIKVKENFDQDIYKLTAEQRESLKVYCKQYRASLR